MKLRHIEVFHTVAGELHFGRAARRLHVAPPAVSQTIAALEEELGVALFDRSRRQIRLTPAGEVFWDESLRVMKHLEQAIDSTRATASGQQGRLSIGFTSVCALGSLPFAVARFREAFPQVELRLALMGTTEQCQALEEGSLDLGFSVHPPEVTSLHVEPIVRSELVALLPSSHPLAAMDKVPLERLLEEPIILMTHRYEPMINKAYRQLCQDAGLPPNILFEVDHLEPALAFVAAGLGFTMAPDLATRLQLEGVVYRSLEPTLPGGIAALWSPEHQRPTIAPFLGLVREQMKAELRPKSSTDRDPASGWA